MIINYGKSVCPKCNHDTLIQGHKVHDESEKWISLKERVENPNIKISPEQKTLWVGDETNFKCNNCNYQLSFKEAAEIPKLPRPDFIIEEVGLAIINPKGLKKIKN